MWVKILFKNCPPAGGKPFKKLPAGCARCDARYQFIYQMRYFCASVLICQTLKFESLKRDRLKFLERGDRPELYHCLIASCAVFLLCISASITFFYAQLCPVGVIKQNEFYSPKQSCTYKV